MTNKNVLDNLLSQLTSSNEESIEKSSKKEEINLKEILALIDLNSKSAWRDELNEEQKKIIKKDFFILNRWMSSVNSYKREEQEHFVLTTNEYYNKHWFELQRKDKDGKPLPHAELMWRLLCMCSYDNQNIFEHRWISNKRTPSKKLSFLEKHYPSDKLSDLDIKCELMTDTEFKQLARDFGYSDKEIKKMF
jgi:hypothetical protein